MNTVLFVNATIGFFGKPFSSSNYFYCILKVGKSNVLCHVYSMGLVRYKHFNLKTGHICPTSSKTLSSKMKISLFIYHINFAFFSHKIFNDR